MLFNSFNFIILFLPFTIIIYFFLNKKSIQIAKLFLVIASLFFYGYFNMKYVIIIISSIIMNYKLGHMLLKYNKTIKKIIIVLGVVFNLGLIIYFKYLGFFIQNINFIFNLNYPLQNILLPLGISFFTFQQLSYLIDCYRGVTLKYDISSYCLFVTFFPQLIAGPIVLPSEMLPQFEDKINKSLNWNNLNLGISIFTIGLAKKVLIADFIAPLANAGFDSDINLNFIDAWITTLSYSMQLYYDFSGYCDMAIGIALMFNIVLPINFNEPYKALNIQDFWKRWHITLSRFLTNYLYIPLGGNRKGEKRTYINLIIVFIISGLWHGAAWTFILWGLLHGFFILIHRIFIHRKRIPNNKNNKIKKTITKWFSWFLTFNIINVLWIFFRAKDLSTVKNILFSMIRISNVSDLIGETYKHNIKTLLGYKLTFIILVFSIILCLMKSKHKTFLTSILEKNTFLFLLLFLISFFLISADAPFLYFNF